MERGGLPFDFDINPRDIDNLLEEAWQKWLRTWRGLQPPVITVTKARIVFTPDGIVAEPIPA